MSGIESRRMKPGIRLNVALTRLSREKWLPGDEVESIASRWAFRICRNHGAASSIVRAAIAHECFIVGMIRGNPPAYCWESHYIEVLDAVRKIKNLNEKIPEIRLLKTVRSL